MMKAIILDRARQYGRLMRLHQPIGAMLLLWPTLWAVWIAGDGRPDPLIAVVFIAGVFVMRSAGCIMNDYADRDLDPRVKRTRDRPIASGRVRPKEALVLFLVLGLVALGLVLLLNRLAILLSLVGMFLAVTYPFVKRYTHLPQVYLGVAFGWGIPMAFAAQTGTVPPIGWLLLVGSVLWSVVYDTMYAMTDRDDDIQVGVKSTAILFGDADRIMVAFVQILMLVVMLFVGRQLEFGLYYHAGLAGASAFGIYQQILIRDRERLHCFRAFRNNNLLGATIFAGLVLEYWGGG